MWDKAEIKQDANDKLVFTVTLHEDDVPMSYQVTLTSPRKAHEVAAEMELEFEGKVEEALWDHPAIIWFNDVERPIPEQLLFHEGERLRAGWRLRFDKKDQAMLFKMMFMNAPKALAA